MKISHVNSYSFNNKSLVVNNTAFNSIAFRGDAKVKKDEYNMGTAMNSHEIAEYIRRKQYKKAYTMMNQLPSNYDPNWQEKNEKPLLLIAASSKPFFSSFKFKTKNKIIHDNILVDIISHPEFDVNKHFTLIDKDGKEYITSYLDEAVDNENLPLLLTILTYARRIQDPHDDHFSTILGKALNTGNYNMELAIRILQDNTPECAEIISISNEGEDVQDESDDEQVGELKGESDIVTVNKEGEKLLNEIQAFISEETPSSIDEVGGLKKAKKDIEDYIITPWQPEIRAKLKANHVSLPNGFLMYGPSGTGKTFIVSTIAKQTGYPLYIITGSTVGSKWMGETPQKLKNIFAELENRYRADKDHKPSILFFDELDDIGGTREGNTSPGKREDVNALLLQLNNAAERGIIAIGATNCIDIVDTALTRSGRFDKKIEVTLPDRDERKDILTKLISKKSICKPLFEHIDLIADKTDGKSPADLAKYIDTCARLAICKQRPVTLENFEELVEEIDLANPRRRIGFSTIR